MNKFYLVMTDRDSSHYIDTANRFKDFDSAREEAARLSRITGRPSVILAATHTVEVEVKPPVIREIEGNAFMEGEKN